MTAQQGKRETRVEKIVAGFYRLSVEGAGFSNIHKRADGWHADIRRPDGELRRFAGIWPTRGEAFAEAHSILEAA